MNRQQRLARVIPRTTVPNWDLPSTTQFEADFVVGSYLDPEGETPLYVRNLVDTDPYADEFGDEDDEYRGLTIIEASESEDWFVGNDLH